MLEENFNQIDESLEDLEALLDSGDTIELQSILNQCSEIIANMLKEFASAHGKENAPDENDLLVLFKWFVKGDPTLNAVRDNIRELVYYQNCLNENRDDALPAKPEKMAVRTARHIYFYFRSRCEQDNLFD